LARLEARVGLANDINAAAATHNLAVRVTALQRLEGGSYFHGSEIWKSGEENPV
jgi:hypothetical protein